MRLNARKVQDGLRLLAPVSRKSYVVALDQKVRVSTEDGMLCVEATDLAHTVKVRVVQVNGGNEILPIIVPRKALELAIGKVGEVLLASDGKTLIVTTDDGETQIARAADLEDWPAKPAVLPGDGATVSGASLAKQLPWLSKAVGKDDRYCLTGVYFDGEGAAVATDGHRLHLAPIENMPKLLMGSAGVTVLSRMAEKFRTVQVNAPSTDGLWSAMAIEDGLACCVIGKVIDGQYPNYQRVLPKDEPRYTPSVPALLAFLRGLPKRKGGKLRSVRFALAHEVLALSAFDSDMGVEAKTTIACGGYEGEEIASCFQPTYIVDAIGDSRTVRFRFTTSSGEPMHLSLDAGRVAIVLPVREASCK